MPQVSETIPDALAPRAGAAAYLGCAVQASLGDAPRVTLPNVENSYQAWG